MNTEVIWVKSARARASTATACKTLSSSLPYTILFIGAFTSLNVPHIELAPAVTASPLDPMGLLGDAGIPE
jgi:hypothetical protein